MSDRHRGPAHAGPSAPATSALGQRPAGVTPASFEVELELARDTGSPARFLAVSDSAPAFALDVDELADQLDRHGPAGDYSTSSRELATRILRGHSA
jgi:hypothetical protein